MKKSLVMICVLLIFLCMTGSSGATPWSHEVLGPVKIGWFGNYSYTHDITYSGFNPGSDFAVDYVLEIGLSDDGRGWDECMGVEIAFVDQPGVLGDGFYDFRYSSNDYGFSLLGLIQLNLLGKLDVTISSLWGDFYFNSSKLVAKGCSNDGVPVPEPATMLLLGIGLIGLAGLGKRIKKAR